MNRLRQLGWTVERNLLSPDEVLAGRRPFVGAALFPQNGALGLTLAALPEDDPGRLRLHAGPDARPINALGEGPFMWRHST